MMKFGVSDQSPFLWPTWTNCLAEVANSFPSNGLLWKPCHSLPLLTLCPYCSIWVYCLALYAGSMMYSVIINFWYPSGIKDLLKLFSYVSSCLCNSHLKSLYFDSFVHWFLNPPCGVAFCVSELSYGWIELNVLVVHTLADMSYLLTWNQFWVEHIAWVERTICSTLDLPQASVQWNISSCPMIRAVLHCNWSAC